MRVRTAVIAVGWIVALAPPLWAVNTPEVPDPPEAVTAAAHHWMTAAKVPAMAIARIQGGRVTWIGTYGERAPGKRVDRDTVFNVASLTKPAFALMSLHLVAGGKLTLDEPLAAYWVDPDVRGDPRHRALTARHALSHQTGFPNWRGERPLGFDFAPGARHEYSGEGYEYLRRAIEVKTGKSMRDWMHTYIVGPLSLRHTSFGWDAALGENLALGYRETGTPHGGEAATGRPPNAAAHLFTSVTDYARFTAWVARGADLPPSLFTDMQSPQTTREPPAEHFGLGWRVTVFGGKTVLSHDGRENGVRTQVFVAPAGAEGLVILTSSDNGELLTRPLVEASWPGGADLLAAMDRDTWAYLHHVPAAEVAGLAHKIAGSPPLLSKLLHAAATVLCDTEKNCRTDAEAVDAFVLALLNGGADRKRAGKVTALLIESTDGEARWRTALGTDLASQWRAALAERDTPRAQRPAKSLGNEVLDRYVGVYRVPSSKLPITIARGPSGIQATAPGMPIVALYAESDTRFFMHQDDTRFEFVVGQGGRSTGLRVIWSEERFELAPRED